MDSSRSDAQLSAEMHIVHEDQGSESNRTSELAVLGITMNSQGGQARDHPDFEWYLRGFERAATEISASCPDPGSQETIPNVVSVQKAVQCPATNEYPTLSSKEPFPDDAPNMYELPGDDFGIFTYKGSLTTPPCSEVVHWNVVDRTMEVSQNQLDRLQLLILCYVQQNLSRDGASVESCHHGSLADSNGSTARPVQPLNGRRVFHHCPMDPSTSVIDMQSNYVELQSKTGKANKPGTAKSKLISSSFNGPSSNTFKMAKDLLLLVATFGTLAIAALFLVVSFCCTSDLQRSEIQQEKKDSLALHTLLGCSKNENDDVATIELGHQGLSARHRRAKV